jgi:hypothetical protein
VASVLESLAESVAADVEADLVAALATVTDLADQVVWAVDIVGAPSALILALLARAERPRVLRLRAGGEHDERRLHR